MPHMAFLRSRLCGYRIMQIADAAECPLADRWGSDRVGAPYLRVSPLGSAVPCLWHPVKPRDAKLPQSQTQLGGVFLDVAHGVKQHFQVARFDPIERAALTCFLIRQRRDARLALAAALVEIGLNLGFGIGAVGQFPAYERRWGRKALVVAGQVEVDPEQRMIGDEPDLSVTRIFAGLPTRPPSRILRDTD